MGVVVQQLPEIGITRVSRWCFNCYVIRGDGDSLVVVDPGMPNVVDDLDPVLAQTPGRVRLVTGTHGHPDHIGGAGRVAQRHAAPIRLSQITLSYLDGVKPRSPSLGKMASPAWQVMRGQPFDTAALAGFVHATLTVGFGTWGGMRWTGPRPAGGLEDGMTLPGASTWTVLTAPGHTDDSICLWHRDSRTLLSGDAVFTAKGRPRFAPDIVDADAATRTESRLRALPVEHLLPGHGLPIHATAMWR